MNGWAILNVSRWDINVQDRPIGGYGERSRLVPYIPCPAT